MKESGVVGSAPHHTKGMHGSNGTVKNNYLFDKTHTMANVLEAIAKTIWQYWKCHNFAKCANKFDK